MRRFDCPQCHASLLEGTNSCPHCEADTSGIAAPPSPGEPYPELDFSSHSQAQRFAELVEESLDDLDTRRFYPLLEFSPWGSPMMERYLKRLESGELECPAAIDLGQLVLREHLSKEQRQLVRHYLVKLQSVPQSVRSALVESLPLAQWTPVVQLSEATQSQVDVMVRSNVLDNQMSIEQRLGLCDEPQLRELLASKGLSTEGGRHEMIGRIFDRVPEEEWHEFAMRKHPGRHVRCKLPIAKELWTYLQIRRNRIDIVVGYVLRRVNVERRCESQVAGGASLAALDAAGCGLPPFHLGCSCDVEVETIQDVATILVQADPDCCSVCAQAAATVRAKAEEAASATVEEPALADIPGRAGDVVDHSVPAEIEPETKPPGQCPRDKERLYRARRGGYLFQACSECAGLWIPPPQMNALLLEHQDLMPQLDTNFDYFCHDEVSIYEKQLCPDCETVELASAEFITVLPDGDVLETDILVHPCPQCHGIWFDHGEMHHIGVAIRDRKQ